MNHDAVCKEACGSPRSDKHKDCQYIPTLIFKKILTYLYIEGKLVTGVQLTVFTAAGVLFVVTAAAAAAIEAQSVHKTRLWGRLHSPCRPLLCPVRHGAGGDVVIDQRLPL